MADVFKEALLFAIEAHDGVTRKTNNIPFILHPMEVASIAATITEDREVLAACLLHDTVEDADVSQLEIQERFGVRVAYLVSSETENKRRDMLPEDSWQIRKEESILELSRSNDRDVKILWLSDKLSNLRAFYRSKLKKGDKMWEVFHQRDPKKHEWYYRSILEQLTELKDTLAYQEYVELIEKIFGE
ncbi:MAG: bifunctional (p)ppGpp synthetase/guanosine-3',5'-bis(diphosphate) 3'-pyrophosphohydrolase [Solobacterium sp.]|nr:bifunctional (p)ppGpp synthetase/guanosine-3',5'-bis(diphosphate) 3'-pyrophosphohydrolase [Solobacterium sp.]